jgi:cell division protein FtsB
MLIFEDIDLMTRLENLRASNRELVRQIERLRDERDIYKEAYHDLLMVVVENGRK